MICKIVASLQGSAIRCQSSPPFPVFDNAMKEEQTRAGTVSGGAWMRVVPWLASFLALIVPHYPKSGPKGVARRCFGADATGSTSFRIGMH